MKLGKIRIIGGRWKSKKISFNLDEALRPTPDRAKEMVFNWLGQDLHDLNCLDLFSGTGAMGFECLSRGAKKVTFVEKDKHFYINLKENLSLFDLKQQVKIFNEDCLIWLKNFNLEEKYNVVFIDPPFNEGLVEKVFILLRKNDYLKKESLVYLETEKNLDINFLDEREEIFKEKSIGDKSYRLIKMLF